MKLSYCVFDISICPPCRIFVEIDEHEKQEHKGQKDDKCSKCQELGELDRKISRIWDSYPA